MIINIHIRLDFTVKLFAFAVSMIAIYDVIIAPAKIGPYGIALDIGNQKELPVFIGCSFNYLIYNTHGNGFGYSFGICIRYIFP